MYETLNEKNILMDIFVNSLFWVHILVILSSLFIGLFFSFPIVLLLILVHRIHVIAFKECALSKIHKYFRGLPTDMSFLQFASLKLLKKRISVKQSKCLDYFFVFFTITMAIFYPL